MNKENNPPAFPTTGPQSGTKMVEGGFITSVHGSQDGMSLRDWFAGMALQGFMASGKCPLDTEGKRIHHPSGYAFVSYEWADAMLLHRQQEQPKEG